jgi:ubiquinone/menaquinone biosynthesis C-methylase UbiE
MTDITLDRVSHVFAAHAPLYRRKAPRYQAAMLRDLAGVWQGSHDRVLDVGGGTGLMAEAIQTLLPARHVVAIDVVDRYYPSLSVETRVYDGRTLPFGDGHFEAATINNVMHHVPREHRPALMAEIARVVSGPIYIKDHLAASRLDHWRLTVLDVIGNIPFGGQIEAHYLSMPEWRQLASAIDATIGAVQPGRYRAPPMAWVFPNRLEITFRFDRR